MAPKSDENGPGITPDDNADAADFQEIASVNNSLDELSNMLDEMENNTENMMAQLRDLLQANREVRAEFFNLHQTLASTSQENEKQTDTTNSSEENSNQDAEMKDL